MLLLCHDCVVHEIFNISHFRNMGCVPVLKKKKNTWKINFSFMESFSDKYLLYKMHQ